MCCRAAGQQQPNNADREAGKTHADTKRLVPKKLNKGRTGKLLRDCDKPFGCG